LEIILEISEQNLQYVSWELHDNIGQILSTASLQLQLLQSQKTINADELNDGVDLVLKAITEIRSLSKSLNFDQVYHQGLINMLYDESKRLNRMKLIFVDCNIEEGFSLDSDSELILFRIIQEFLNNSIKHAQAKKAYIKICLDNNILKVFLSDTGKGFNLDKVKQGNGLINITSRIKSLNGKYDFHSKIGEGTLLKIKIPVDE